MRSFYTGLTGMIAVCSANDAVPVCLLAVAGSVSLVLLLRGLPAVASG
jgi:hypothetical protein